MLAPSVSTITTLSLPFSNSGRPSVYGAACESTRQPQAMPSGTLVLPVGCISSIAASMAILVSLTLTSVSGVIGVVVQPRFGPVHAGWDCSGTTDIANVAISKYFGI